MLYLQCDNLLSTRVGLTDGISEAQLKSFSQKNQSLVETVFQSKMQAGYHFLSLPDDKKLAKDIHHFVQEQKKNQWAHVVILGIGGSALGPLALQEGLVDPFTKGPKLHVLDNVDPVQAEVLLSHLPLSKTLFVVISKSGTTTEPMALYAVVVERLKKKFKNHYQRHLVFITDPKEGLLRKIAQDENINAFDIPAKIGGRFSVLTAVGLLPCALIGIDIESLLRGAKQMRDRLKKLEGYENPALKLAVSQFLLDQKKGKVMTVLMPYSKALFRMGDWYRQLLAESIGKKSSVGPTPINALGTTDQHSQLQLYNDGPNNKFIVFMRVLNPSKDLRIPAVLPKTMSFLNGKKLSEVMDASYLGTAEALTKHKRPNVTLEVPKVDAFHLGAMIMLFEFEVALLGLLYKVDAFNQPGVEHSKKITKQLLMNAL